MRTIDLAEAAIMLKTHEDTVAECIRARGLPAVKVGRAWVLVDEDVIGWLRAQYHPRESRAGVQEAKCESTAVARAASGGLTSPSRASRDLRAALEPRTKPRRANGPPKLTAISGASSD